MKLAIGIGVGLLATGLHVMAADPDNGGVVEELTVVSTRIAQPVRDVPAAMTIIDKATIQRGRQQLGLDESLNRVPGVFSQNRYNFAQDLRIAVRGFGARANFGIRGVKIYADGIPATTADGQAGVDDIDLGSIERIEVTRGPYSALYGASSGGVINLVTEDGPTQRFVETSIIAGEDKFQRFQLKSGGQSGPVNYLMSLSDLSYKGYRDLSEVDATLFNSKFRYEINNESDLTIVLNYVDSPQADDAGGITSAMVAQDPKQAQPRNLSSNAGEALNQQKVGFVYRQGFGDGHEMIVRNYYVWRDFEAFLPIGSHIPFVADDGVVEFERFFYGGGVQFNFASELFGMRNQFLVGVDIDRQEDDRQRFINDAGVKGALSFDQLEEAKTYGVFFRNELGLSESVGLIVGARYDRVDLSVDDQFLANADQSSSIDFNEVSPMVGLVWHASDQLTVYANYGSSFETPTFTELANPARSLSVSLGGFDNVNAQEAQSAELGIRGEAWDGRVQYDLAAYTMQVEDEITSVANIGNRSFFENADTDRSGVELSASAELVEGLRVTLAYTYSDFEFDNFVDDPSLNGNHLPGLPESQAFAEISYSIPNGIYFSADVLYVDDIFVNNANSVTNGSSTVANFRAGQDFVVGRWHVRPFLGLNNLTNREYMSNIRINGFGGRVFEPGPERNLYGGLSVNYDL